MSTLPDLKVEQMPTADLVTYAGNAKKHPAKQVREIANSIEHFGFSDPVGVWTRPDGRLEIIEGHGRVMAAKLLGLEAVPVIRLDHLDNDARRAYSHVHNITNLMSGLDFDALELDLASIPSFDWADFGVEAVDEDYLSVELGEIQLEKPNERIRTDRKYNLHLINKFDCGNDGMPRIKSVDHTPAGLIGFNYARTTDKKDLGVHFFLDDYQFERCWSNPQAQLPVLSAFDCVLTPDFSLYADMPLPMQQWNVYRSRALGSYWQRNGIIVIPTLSWSTKDTLKFAFAGLEKEGTYAVSTVGVVNDPDAIAIWHDGMNEALRLLHPKRIIQYGNDIGFEYGSCEVVNIRNTNTERFSNGR